MGESMIDRPDFILAGVPKSGTTAVWTWLNSHPDVHMSKVKEPGFFAWSSSTPTPRSGPFDDLYYGACVTKPEDYAALFAGADGRKRGEASVIYALTPEAPGRIAHALPGVKVVLILRDPVARAFSQFSHHVRDGLEPLSDFEAALRAEPERLASGWSPFHGYMAGSRYEKIIARFRVAFPAADLHIMLYDDLLADPNATWDELCRFIGIGTRFRPNFALRTNVATGQVNAARSAMLRRALQRPGPTLAALYRSVPQPIRRPVREMIDRLNVARGVTLSDKLARSLAEELAADIAATERATGRNLSPWHRRLRRSEAA